MASSRDFAVALLFLTFAWWLYSMICLLRNYLIARKVGIPIRVLFIPAENPFWLMVDSKVVTFVCKILPFLRNSSFARYNWRGWEVQDKCRSALEMGTVWMHVTPTYNSIQVCDPDALMEIFRRKHDFPRPLHFYTMLNPFGPNLVTVDGDQWKRQRKSAASCFNEPNNEIVWSESLAQADDMIRYWASKPSITSTADDSRTLSLHILSRAGFGRSFKFQGHLEKTATAAAMNYKESLQIVLDKSYLIMALGTKFLAKPWLPASLRRVHQAIVAFQQYMTPVYEEEKRSMAQNGETNRTLMSTLVRASAEETDPATRLTERELYGNMFIFNFAGHDTTTHSIVFSLMHLAINPDVQEWISEEICSVFGDSPVSEWDYSNFPRLKRCVAVLMESLRLYTLVPMSKWTDAQAQQLTIGGGKTITIPPKTTVLVAYAAVHTHPDYWGPDALEWRPARWIKRSGAAEEELITPRRGTYVGWSEGERNCPGKKFSQVEFAATMAALFRDYRVDPTQRPGESADNARRRIMHQLEIDSAQVLLLQMLHPERAALRWRKKGENVH
ncbi:hypothetical protein PG997_007231 [Apiospora hydei]|uniref:Cytochrome P450 n=1 Tax=Apiospora hydei TaxID=1337664 RepID=A0ABR1WB81_9PEZI